MIRLAMIVKNESEVIERGLRAVLPFVDTWCIVDTGSTDDTKEKIIAITSALGKPGVLYDREWVNFAHNRSEALRLGRTQAPASDYLLMIDADDIFQGPKTGGKISIPTGLDAVNVKCVMNLNSVFYRIHCFSAKRNWVYKGVVHEYADMADADGKPLRVGSFDDIGCWIDVRTEGSRSKNPRKYEDDAVILDAELVKTPDDSRYQFYAAQSWRDAGNKPKALVRYLKRVEMKEGYGEERYVALLNAIRLTDSFEDAVKYTWHSIEINAKRREAAFALFRRARERPPKEWTQELYALGSFVDAAASSVVLPSFLFAEDSTYTWAFSDEFCIISFFTGHKEAAIRLAVQALMAAPESQRARIQKNLEQSLKMK